MPAHKKDDSVRRRTNSSSSAKVLLFPVKRPKVPPLPTTIKWYPQVREWWKRSWSSPMVVMWSDADRDMMFLAARLWQQFWDVETSASTRNQTSAQIRSVADQLGLSPMARHRMGWAIADADQVAAASSRATSTRAPAKRASVTVIDPRQKRRLAAVK